MFFVFLAVHDVIFCVYAHSTCMTFTLTHTRTHTHNILVNSEYICLTAVLYTTIHSKFAQVPEALARSGRSLWYKKQTQPKSQPLRYKGGGCSHGVRCEAAAVLLCLCTLRAMSQSVMPPLVLWWIVHLQVWGDYFPPFITLTENSISHLDVNLSRYRISW
jgi:hypothetical protein